VLYRMVTLPMTLSGS